MPHDSVLPIELLELRDDRSTDNLVLLEYSVYNIEHFVILDTNYFFNDAGWQRFAGKFCEAAVVDQKTYFDWWQKKMEERWKEELKKPFERIQKVKFSDVIDELPENLRSFFLFHLDVFDR